MVELASFAPVAAALIVALLALGGIALIEITSRSRLVRCPETGSVALVEIAPARRDGARAQVLSCDLWAGPGTCARGCLQRFSKSERAHRAALEAARSR